MLLDLKMSLDLIVPGVSLLVRLEPLILWLENLGAGVMCRQILSDMTDFQFSNLSESFQKTSESKSIEVKKVPFGARAMSPSHWTLILRNP